MADTNEHAVLDVDPVEGKPASYMITITIATAVANAKKAFYITVSTVITITITITVAIDIAIAITIPIDIAITIPIDIAITIPIVYFAMTTGKQNSGKSEEKVVKRCRAQSLSTSRLQITPDRLAICADSVDDARYIENWLQSESQGKPR